MLSQIFFKERKIYLIFESIIFIPLKTGRNSNKHVRFNALVSITDVFRNQRKNHRSFDFFAVYS